MVKSGICVNFANSLGLLLYYRVSSLLWLHGAQLGQTSKSKRGELLSLMGVWLIIKKKMGVWFN